MLVLCLMSNWTPCFGAIGQHKRRKHCLLDSDRRCCWRASEIASIHCRVSERVSAEETNVWRVRCSRAEAVLRGYHYIAMRGLRGDCERQLCR